MIDYDRVISWAERRLGLREQPRYDRGDAEAAIGDVVDEISAMVPTSRSSVYPLTTTAGTGTYAVPGRSPLLLSVQWPSEWGDGLKFVTRQHLHEILAQNSLDARDPRQPEYYSFWWDDASDGVLTLAYAESVAAGLTINLHVLGVEDMHDIMANPPASGEMPLHSSLELAAKNGVAFRLAQVYAPNVAPYWQAQFERALDIWQAAYIIPNTVPTQTVVKPF